MDVRSSLEFLVVATALAAATIATTTVEAVSAATATTVSTAAAITTAVAAIAETTTVSTTAASATTAEAGSVALGTGACLVHDQITAVEILAIRCLDGCTARCVIGHFHESEATAAVCGLVHDDLGRCHLSVWFE